MINFMYYFLIVIEAICSFLLLSVILIQRSKGSGMGAAFGGGMGETIFGAQMGNVLTKTTVILAIIFLANTTLLAMLGARRTERSATDSVSVVPEAGPAPRMPSGGIPGESQVPPLAPAEASASAGVMDGGDAGDRPVTFGVPPSSEPAVSVPPLSE